MHLLCWLLTPSSLVLPWETDGSSGKMDIRISQGLGDSDGWLFLGIVVPQNSLWLWPLHVALSRAQPGWGFGERLKSSFQTNTAEIQRTRSSLDPSQVSFSTGPKNRPRGFVPTFLVGHRISEGAIQTSAWDVLTASSASSAPSSYSEISLCQSQPTCHDNTASHCKFSSCCCSACSQFS